MPSQQQPACQQITPILPMPDVLPVINRQCHIPILDTPESRQIPQQRRRVQGLGVACYIILYEYICVEWDH